VSREEPVYEVQMKQDLVLRLTLVGVEPELYREFRVSSAMTLHALADKILIPVMGWMRGYHSYKAGPHKS
jgi:hypothetical protein